MNLYSINKRNSSGSRVYLLATAMSPGEAIHLINGDEEIKNDLKVHGIILDEANVSLIGSYGKDISKIFQYKSEIVKDSIDGPRLVTESTVMQRKCIAGVFCNMAFLLVLSLASSHPLSLEAFRSSLLPFLIMILPIAFISSILVDTLTENENDEIMREFFKSRSK